MRIVRWWRGAGISSTYSNDQAATDEFVEVTSGLLLLFAIGAVVGPMLAAGMMALIGIAGLFTFTAFVHALLAASAVWRTRQRLPPYEEQRVPFSVSMSAGHTMAPDVSATLADLAAQPEEDGTLTPSGSPTGT